MTPTSFLLTGGAVLLAAAAPAPAPSVATPTYRVAAPIAGPDGAGWDYASVDAATHQLYVAHGDAVTRVDLARVGWARVDRARGDRAGGVTSIGAAVHAHAVVPMPNGMLLVTSGRDDSVRLIDATTGRERAKIAVGNDPDAALFDSESGHAFVMNAHGGTISEIDPVAMTVVRTIAAKPGLEFAALGRDRTLYVNNEDANEIEVVDLAVGKMVRAIPLPGCQAPSGLAFDAAHDRLISACANGKAAVVDTRAGKMTTLVAIGRGPDAVMIDPQRQVALIPCGGDGVLAVLSLAGTVVRKVASVPTALGARTGAVDTTTGIVYLPTATLDRPATAGGRPVGRPGTFHLVVVKPV